MNNQKGQTLLEAVVALSILLIIIAASSIAILSAVNNSSYERNLAVANKYAQEGMEYVRNLKNSNASVVDTMIGASNLFCLDQLYSITTPITSLPVFPPDATPSTACSTLISGTQFRRYVQFGTDTGTCKPGDPPLYISGTSVKVTVEWESGRCPTDDPFCNRINMKSCF